MYGNWNTVPTCTILNGLCWMNFVSRKLDKVAETSVFILVY